MKLLAHFNNLINTNNVAQLQKDCQLIQKLQDVLSPNKIKLFDYQEVINQLIVTAANSDHDNPPLMEQLLKSNPEPTAVVEAAGAAFLKKHSKQFNILLQDKNILKIIIAGVPEAVQHLAKAIRLAQIELGWLQSNTSLIAQCLKNLLQCYPVFLINWLRDLHDGKITLPLNEKQAANFNNALKTLTDPVIKPFPLDQIPNNSQLALIENKARELIGKLILEIKNTKNNDDNIGENWHAEIIWYIKNKDVISDSDEIRKRKEHALELMIEKEVNLDFYLDNPHNIDLSLKKCAQTTVRALFINSCIEYLQNRNVVVNEDDWDVMQTVELAGFNNSELFSYDALQIKDKDFCNNLMTVFNQNPDLKHLIDLIETKRFPLLYGALRYGNPHVHCFTQYRSEQFFLEVGGNYSWTILHVAAQFNPSAIEYLSTLAGFDVNTLDSNGNTPLHIAAEFNPAAFEPLLKIKRINVNAVNKKKISVLAMGQQYQPEHLQRLLDHPELIINPSLLTTVIMAKQFTLLQQLLDKNIGVNTPDKFGNTPLHIAAEYFPEAIAPLSVKIGIDGLNARNELKQTPLHLAASKNLNSVVELLKLNGVDVNARDHEDCTPLLYSFHDNAEAAKLLLKREGIDVNSYVNDGELLVILASQDYPELVEPLLDCAGIYVNVATSDNDTLLHLNIKNLKILERLLKNKDILVNEKNVRGYTALHFAVTKNHLAIPLFENAEEFEPNIPDRSGNTALHKAISPLAMEQLLKLKNINVNAKNQSDETPLHIAAKNSAEVVALLLAAEGIDVNAQTTTGDTPLHFAARYNHSIIELLLNDKRVLPNLTNKDGKTPLGLLDIINTDKKTIALLTEAIKKAEESFAAANLDEICQSLANPKFLQVAKEQKYSKNFLDLGNDNHFGRHLACDAFCGAIIYCNTPTLLTFESWLVGQMKLVIELDVEMFDKFVTLVSTNLITNPFTLAGWKKWVGVMQIVSGDAPVEALQKSLDTIKNYQHPDAVEKPLVAALAVAPVASIVASGSNTRPDLSNDEIDAIKAAVAKAFEKLAEVQPLFELDLIHNLRSLVQPNVTSSEAASLEQTKNRIKARKWCEQFKVGLPSLLARHAEYVNGDLQRATLALNLLNETVLDVLKKLPVPQAAASSSSLFGESRHIFLADASEERAFVSAPVKENEDLGQELLEITG